MNYIRLIYKTIWYSTCALLIIRMLISPIIMTMDYPAFYAYRHGFVFPLYCSLGFFIIFHFGELFIYLIFKKGGTKPPIN